jgi:hypothetical protein
MLRGKAYHMSLLVVVAFLVVFSGGCGTQSRTSTGVTANADVQNTPTATAIPFDLDSPAGVAQAIVGDPMVRAFAQRFDAQTLDTPALVWYQNGSRGPQLTDRDHWVVTARNAAGQRSAIYDFEYVRSQHRLRASSAGVITPEDPNSAAAFPLLGSATAVERLHALRGLAPAAGSAPRMIWFSIDDRWRDPSSLIKWYGGGESAMDPMWLIQATDGVTYYVGQDLKVYVYADLPIEPAYK